MDETLCLEIFEGADVKHHGTVVFSSSFLVFFPAQKYVNKTNLGLNLKNYFLQEILHFDKLKVVKSSMTIVFSSSSLKIAK